jgi:hypothetical protein
MGVGVITNGSLTPAKERGYNIEERQRILWMGIRQALIIALGAIEDFLGLERSIIPRKRRGDG